MRVVVRMAPRLRAQMRIGSSRLRAERDGAITSTAFFGRDKLTPWLQGETGGHA